ncbi:hypothetical protein F4810DRAFT_646418 [Camillea tinctor]|nr:hypothetical protein F4810DRAFT_646418 [Camillea tinctor]
MQSLNNIDKGPAKFISVLGVSLFGGPLVGLVALVSCYVPNWTWTCWLLLALLLPCLVINPPCLSIEQQLSSFFFPSIPTSKLTYTYNSPSSISIPIPLPIIRHQPKKFQYDQQFLLPSSTSFDVFFFFFFFFKLNVLHIPLNTPPSTQKLFFLFFFLSP